VISPRLSLIAAVALTVTGVGVATAGSLPTRSGCAIVTDRSGDTAADVGAPATVPQSDGALDISAVDLASNAKWIGARVRLADFDAKPPATGGESFEVSARVGGGTLVLGVGRYANPTGIVGNDLFGYAGFQRGTIAPRDVPARAVQLSVDPASRAVSVFVDRAALREIGANLSGYASGITAFSGRQYGDEFTVGYDNATGTHGYLLGAASCLRLPSS
jgi:hypothetical protein